MVKQLKTSITIHAKKEKVWKILMDFENYPKWNPFIKSITGETKAGKQLEVKIQNMTFKPIILSHVENEEFIWKGHLFFKGLFDGEHKFKLLENKDGTTHFEQSEKFTGILVKLFENNLDKNTKDGFEKMNLQLKLRSEKKTPQQQK